MIIKSRPPEAAVKMLLATAQLPTIDITAKHLDDFLGAWEGADLEGVVGVELLGSVALLRSLAVTESKRRSGLGTALLAQAEIHAAQNNVCTLYLLTTTAESYFKKRGYAPIAQESAPEIIRSTTEFALLCPASSVLMMKPIPETLGP